MMWRLHHNEWNNEWCGCGYIMWRGQNDVDEATWCGREKIIVDIHIALGEHHKQGASGYTWSSTAYIILPQIDDVQCHTQTHMQFKNRHHWLHGPAVLCMYQQPSTTLQNSTTKRAGLTLKGTTYHGKFAKTFSRNQVFEKMFWKLTQDASQKSS